MKDATLKSRAIVFASCAGGVAFFLSLLATANATLAAGDYARALIPAIVCAIMCWASAQRIVACAAEALDLAVERIAQAAKGDLTSPIPPEVGAIVPRLSAAMESLFSQLGANLERAERLAMFDAVTALPNRASFRTACDATLVSLGDAGTSALLFIDLDRFKAVNDTRGHAAGDMLLAEVAQRLRSVAEQATRERALGAPIVGRLAGDEFTIFLPAIDGPADADWVANRVMALLSQPFELGDARVEIGASIGIATRPAHGRTLHELMRAADAAMYRAKHSGRGRVEHFGAAIATDLAARSALDGDLRRAIDNGEFALVFQPQLSLGADGPATVEALLRWTHPQEGVRLPGSFLDRAEESGLIVEIGEWVVREVARTLARWSAAGIEARMAVNVSPRQIAQADFFRRLREELHRHGAPARTIELELGETLAMKCSPELSQAIDALRADGATIAIDGFGAGYSSIGRLRALPVDRIKVDRSLIAGVAESHAARSVVQALIGLIHGIGREAVGEGIETQAQADVLRVLGCDVIQGFGVAEPMAEGELLAWLAARSPVQVASARAITSA